MLPDAAYFASDDLDDTRDPFALDPDIDALCAGCDPLAGVSEFWACMTKTTGITRDAYYAQLSHMLLMAGVREISGYQGSERRKRGARHRAYSLGVVKPPRRATRADKLRRDDIAFGLIEVGAA